MAVRTANAEWKGTLAEGTGRVESESGALEGAYSFGSRFQEGEGTNPEELIAAAHAACFSMALAGGLAQGGHTPDSVRTEGRVHLDKVEGGFRISRVHLKCEARVPGIDEATFQEQVRDASEGCPVSQALKALEIDVDARLVS